MSVRKAVLLPFAGFFALTTVTMTGANAASIDGEFNAALDRMLMGMKTGPVSQMSEPEKKELVACVQKVFGKLPDDKKKYIVEASGEAELRERFDEIGLENDSALKQEVRDECA